MMSSDLAILKCSVSPSDDGAEAVYELIDEAYKIGLKDGQQSAQDRIDRVVEMLEVKRGGVVDVYPSIKQVQDAVKILKGEE